MQITSTNGETINVNDIPRDNTLDDAYLTIWLALGVIAFYWIFLFAYMPLIIK